MNIKAVAYGIVLDIAAQSPHVITICNPTILTVCIRMVLFSYRHLYRYCKYTMQYGGIVLSLYRSALEHILFNAHVQNSV